MSRNDPPTKINYIGNPIEPSTDTYLGGVVNAESISYLGGPVDLPGIHFPTQGETDTPTYFGTANEVRMGWGCILCSELDANALFWDGGGEMKWDDGDNVDSDS